MKEEILLQFFPCSQECKDKINELEDKFGMTTKCVCGQMIERAKLSKALEEYADWKIKECLPEKLKKTSEEYSNWSYWCGFNDCIDQILTNKDKIK